MKSGKVIDTLMENVLKQPPKRPTQDTNIFTTGPEGVLGPRKIGVDFGNGASLRDWGK